VLDDYDKIKEAFKKFKIKEDRDFLGNPILKIKVGKWLLTFYFDVDVYKDEAYLSNLMVGKYEAD